MVQAAADAPAEPRPRPGVALLLAATLIVLASLATWLGADDGRRDPDAAEQARAALDRALELGREDAGVREALRGLRRTLGRRPLDGKTRVAYAGLLLGVTADTADLPASAFHARTAARLAPVTVPVVRSAVQVLLRTGDTDEALGWIRAMFGYEPGAAASLLARIEPYLDPADVERGLAEAPPAWLAWSLTLRREGRREESAHSLGRARERWPGDPGLLGLAATAAANAGDWDALERMLPPHLTLPEEPETAGLHLQRARLRAARGDPDGARGDLATALRLNPRSPWFRFAAGDVHLALGDADEARRMWNRLLFTLPHESRQLRRATLHRLARLEESQGRAGAALRHWRTALELDPTDDEARRRIADLTGGTP